MVKAEVDCIVIGQCWGQRRWPSSMSTVEGGGALLSSTGVVLVAIVNAESCIACGDSIPSMELR